MHRWIRRRAAPLAVAALGLGAAYPVHAADAPLVPYTASEERALYQRLCGLVATAYDSAHGGFAEKRGAPVPGAVALAFAITRDGGNPLWLERGRATVDWTWSLFDSVGGGFLESTRDVRHDVPSFEKRTDSNAHRLENLMDAWLTTHDPIYRRRAAQVVDFFDRVLLDARGGFVAGQIGDRDLVPESDGLAIQAWLRWSALTAEPRVRDFGWKSLERTWEQCWNPDFGMLRHGAFGELLKAPQLSDQVEAGRAYALAAQLGGRAADLERARAIGDLLIRRFEYPLKGGFRTQAVPDRKGQTRNAARVSDENARAALFLAELASVSGDPRYRESAARAVRSFEHDFEKGGLELADWALAVRALSRPDLPARPEWKSVEVPRPQVETVAPAPKKKPGR